MSGEIQATPFDVEQFKSRLQKMSDAELRRCGLDAKYMCSPWANLNKPPLEIYVIQLQEARAEWRRRFPKLPMNESV